MITLEQVEKLYFLKRKELLRELEQKVDLLIINNYTELRNGRKVDIGVIIPEDRDAVATLLRKYKGFGFYIDQYDNNPCNITLWIKDTSVGINSK